MFRYKLHYEDGTEDWDDDARTMATESGTRIRAAITILEGLASSQPEIEPWTSGE